MKKQMPVPAPPNLRCTNIAIVILVSLSLGFQKQEFRTPILQKVGPSGKSGSPIPKSVPQIYAFHSEW